MAEISDKVKKNLLDLHYNRNLQYFNTAIILLFTYFISVGIVFITKQLDYTNFNQLLLVSLVSILFIGVDILSMLRFRFHMKNIQEEIKKLILD